ncbi:putative membrane protein YfcA [Methanomicrobium sp. W14]|uniref:sulfite exporter TauE/SafE family protein n=1 Tax=Methanomicrobium sp. W14 TaxID=2817839 RepID=UPI001AE95518|nr:sulfite exporter TauE/SafE family protein [Methanomicrobium sp. W14]MBP2132693.1 putative membrane protein YfcA [Methanomicrobium sp. W14]
MDFGSGLVTYFILCIGGALAGLFSGMLGIGGGTVLVPVQYSLLSGPFALDSDTALRFAIATSLAVTLPTSLSSAYGHYRKGVILKDIGVITAVCGFFGGILGGIISSNLSSSVLAPFFAVVMILMAFLLFSVKLNPDINMCVCQKSRYIIAGFSVGVVSSMIGIGGGVILAPLLMLFCRFPSKTASATTSVFVIGVSVGGLLSYITLGGIADISPFFTLGYINLTWWVILILISVPMAQVGVHLLHKINQNYVKYVYIALLLFLTTDMLGII